MRVPFVATCVFSDRDALDAVAELLPRGQWVRVAGVQARLIGTLDGRAWIISTADGAAKPEAFARACRAFTNASTAPQRQPVAAVPASPARVVAAARFCLPLAFLCAALAFAVAAYLGQDVRGVIAAALCVGAARWLDSLIHAPRTAADDETVGYSLHNARRI